MLFKGKLVFEKIYTCLSFRLKIQKFVSHANYDGLSLRVTLNTQENCHF